MHREDVRIFDIHRYVRASVRKCSKSNHISPGNSEKRTQYCPANRRKSEKKKRYEKLVPFSGVCMEKHHETRASKYALEIGGKSFERFISYKASFKPRLTSQLGMVRRTPGIFPGTSETTPRWSEINPTPKPFEKKIR